MRAFHRSAVRVAMALALLGSSWVEKVHAQPGSPGSAGVPATTPTEPGSVPPASPSEPEPPAPATLSAFQLDPTLAPKTASPPQQPAAEGPVNTDEPPPLQQARLDYTDGSFYLRAFNDQVVWLLSGRMQVDTYTYTGDGVSDYHRANGTGLKTNIFFRRFVVEAGGIIRRHWFWWMGGNFGPDPIVDAQQLPLSNAHVYDGWVGYTPRPTLRIYFGQFNAPVTMENVTSSRWLDFMERALMVRTLAAPANKAIGPMIWGDTKDRMIEGQIGGLSMDGTINRPDVDGHYQLMGRFVVRPLARRTDALKWAHLGTSGRYGTRNPKFAGYDFPPLTTPGGYAFWPTTYGTPPQQTVIIPDAKQAAIAAEGYLPFERWDLRSEFVWVYEQTREALATNRFASLRGGLFKGYGLYAQASIWLAGTPRIQGQPGSYYGIYAIPSKFKPQAPYGVQFLLRGEVLRLTYDANSRFGSPGGPDTQTNAIRVNTFQTCLNVWMTKHIRLTAEYSLYQFPGTPKADNQALAPGARAGTSPNAHVLNEISFRVGLAI